MSPPFLPIVFVKPSCFGGVWTDQRHVVPGDFRQRLGQFLQPAVVGEATVVDCWIGAENNFESAGAVTDCWPLDGRRSRCAGITRGANRNCLRGQRSVRNEPIVQTLAPPRSSKSVAGVAAGLACAVCSCRLPLPPAFWLLRLLSAACRLLMVPACQYSRNNLVRLAIVLRREHCQHFMRSLAVVKRLNQRLDNRHRAIVRTRIAPRFEVVRFRNVPVTKLRSLVFV